VAQYLSRILAKLCPTIGVGLRRGGWRAPDGLTFGPSGLPPSRTEPRPLAWADEFGTFGASGVPRLPWATGPSTRQTPLTCTSQNRLTSTLRTDFCSSSRRSIQSRPPRTYQCLQLAAARATAASPTGGFRAKSVHEKPHRTAERGEGQEMIENGPEHGEEDVRERGCRSGKPTRRLSRPTPSWYKRRCQPNANRSVSQSPRWSPRIARRARRK